MIDISNLHNPYSDILNNVKHDGSQTIYINYSDFYDSIYAQKDYGSEALRLVEFLKRHGLPMPASLLDVGSGTGRHLEALGALQVSAEGVEPSDTMLQKARERGMKVHSGYIDELQTQGKFDVCTALFAVLNYIAPRNLAHFFESVAVKLNKSGFLAVEIWSSDLRPERTTERVFKHLGEEFVRTVVPRRTGELSWDLSISVGVASSGEIVAEERHRIYSHSFETLRDVAAASKLESLDVSPLLLNSEDPFHETHLFQLRS